MNIHITRIEVRMADGIRDVLLAREDSWFTIQLRYSLGLSGDWQTIRTVRRRSFADALEIFNRLAPELLDNARTS